MALDPSIILSGQQQPSFADTYGKAIQLKALVNQGKLQDLQYQQTQQDMEGARKLRDLYSGNINEDGSINRAGILQGAASQGLGDKIQGLQKSWAETDKATADLDLSRAKTGGEHFDIAKKKLDAVNGMLGSLLTRPDVSQNDVAAGFAQLAQQGLIENDEAVRAMRSLPAPEQLRPYLIQKANEGLGAMKQMELAQQRAIADQNASVTRRGQDMTADTQRQLASQGVSIQTDANGNMIVVPNRAPAGSPVTASPVLDAAGDPVRSKQSQLNAKQIQAAQGKLQTVAILRKQLDNLKAARANLGGASEGIVMGRNPVSESGSNYDAALAALQTTIRQLTRTPGEGSMSDYESRIAQQQLPQRADYGSSIDQKIAQIEDLANVIESGYSGMIEPGQSTPAKPAARPPLSAFQR